MHFPESVCVFVCVCVCVCVNYGGAAYSFKSAMK
jgi:hypothetical protein